MSPGPRSRGFGPARVHKQIYIHLRLIISKRLVIVIIIALFSPIAAARNSNNNRIITLIISSQTLNSIFSLLRLFLVLFLPL